MQLIEDPTEKNDVRKAIKSLATEIETWRVAHNQSKEELCARYPDLGSARTFNRGLKGQLDDTNDLVKFRTVHNLTEIDDGERVSALTVHDDFAPFMAARQAFIDMAKENGVRRFLPLLGHSGAGKTTFVSWLSKRYPGRVVTVEALPAWKNSKGNGTDKALCEAILEKLGCKAIPVRGATLAKRTIEYLNHRRITIAVEEAHELCENGLMMMKSLINATQGEFVVTAHPKLWSDLQKASHSACSQLSGNRLWERIDFDFTAEDVAIYLEREMPAFESGAKDRLAAAEQVQRLACPNGGWNFVRGVCDILRKEGVETMTVAAVVKATQKEVCRR